MLFASGFDRKVTKFSITSIIAIALLSGTPQLPPVVEPVIALETAGAPTAAPEQGTQATVPPSTDGAEVPSQSSDTQTPVTPVAAEKAIIVVTANQGPPKGDPIAVVNEVSFGAVQSVDKAIIAPIAYGYRDGLPAPIRDGMHNVLNNLDEPVVFLNFLLQLKIGKAAETVGRFAINSTIGVAGLFDFAKGPRQNLLRRGDRDFDPIEALWLHDRVEQVHDLLVHGGLLTFENEMTRLAHLSLQNTRRDGSVSGAIDDIRMKFTSG